MLSKYSLQTPCKMSIKLSKWVRLNMRAFAGQWTVRSIHEVEVVDVFFLSSTSNLCATFVTPVLYALLYWATLCMMRPGPPCFNMKCHLNLYRKSHYDNDLRSFSSIMGIPILISQHLYTESDPQCWMIKSLADVSVPVMWWHVHNCLKNG